MIADEIVVVSGLPRSGTSMMMSMLSAGGIAPLKDELRQADEDNPRGYWEDDRVKRLRDDSSWMGEARGKVVKVVSALLPYLPSQFQYRVIFMERALPEILASQNKMLERSGRQPAATDDKMTVFYSQHLDKIRGWLATQANVTTQFLSFSEVVRDPRQAADDVATFLTQPLDIAQMVSVVDAALYRKRA